MMLFIIVVVDCHLEAEWGTALLSINKTFILGMSFTDLWGTLFDKFGASLDLTVCTNC